MEHCKCDCALDGHDECQIGDEEECDRLTFQLLADEKLPLTYDAGKGYKPKVPRSMCVHALDRYVLGNGSEVYLSGAFDDRFRDWIPDVGFYLDGTWDRVSESFSYLIPWRDYGLPEVSYDVMTRYAKSVLDHVAFGESVEIGCLGSHGRTGTFVAILEIVASGGEMSAMHAIGKVRDGHCFKCVESENQEWYVKAFRAHFRGERIPRKPRRKKVVLPPTATVTTLPDTATATTLPDNAAARIAASQSVGEARTPSDTSRTPSNDCTESDGTKTPLYDRTALQIALERMEERDEEVNRACVVGAASAVNMTADEWLAKRGIVSKRGIAPS